MFGKGSKRLTHDRYLNNQHNGQQSQWHMWPQLLFKCEWFLIGFYVWNYQSFRWEVQLDKFKLLGLLWPPGLLWLQIYTYIWSVWLIVVSNTQIDFKYGIDGVDLGANQQICKCNQCEVV